MHSLPAILYNGLNDILQCKGLTPVIMNTTVDWTPAPFCLVDMNP